MRISEKYFPLIREEGQKGRKLTEQLRFVFFVQGGDEMVAEC